MWTLWPSAGSGFMQWRLPMDAYLQHGQQAESRPAALHIEGGLASQHIVHYVQHNARWRKSAELFS